MVWNYTEWGGAQIFFLGIAQQLAKDFDITFVIPRDTAGTIVEMCGAAGFAIEFLEHSVGAESGVGLVRKIRRHIAKVRSECELLRRLKREKFDIVHVELGPWQSVLTIILLAIRTNVLHTVHNRLPRVRGLRRLSWLFKFRLAALFPPAGIFAANEDAKQSLVEYAPRHYVDRVTVAPAHVITSELEEVLQSAPDRAAVRSILVETEGDFLVVTVGQFIERKGPWNLLEAAKTLNDKGRGFSFVWITATDISEEVRRRIASYGVGDAFRIMQMSDFERGRQGILEAVWAADCFLLPSSLEGLSIAMLEAMCLGTPCVATEVGGTAEAIVDRETGLLVRAGAPDQIVAAVEDLRADHELRGRIGDAARRRVMADYTVDRVAGIMADVYRAALGGRK